MRIKTPQDKNTLKGYKNGVAETKEKSIHDWTDRVRRYIPNQKDKEVDNQYYLKHNQKIENKSLLNSYAFNKTFT